MDPEFDQGRGRYGFCRAGFGLLAVGLGLLCIYDVAWLLQVFGFARQLGPIHANRGWFWLVDAPIPWTTFLGSALLWGLWPIGYWQRRAVPLVLMNAADAAFWLMFNGEALGLTVPDWVGRHAWPIQLVTMGFGWVELLLAATLAASVSRHLGSERTDATWKVASLFCGLGLSIWALYALSQTDWFTWPLARARFGGPAILLILISHVLRIGATFQVAGLCLTVARECRQYVRAWEKFEASGELPEPHPTRGRDAAQRNVSSAEGKRPDSTSWT